jgi:hypothetical protein
MSEGAIMVTESTPRQAPTLRGSIVLRAAAMILLALGMMLPVGPARSDNPPAGIFIYAISRDGTLVGQQRMEFVADGEKLRVISRMQLDVTLLGMTIYSFDQQAEEVRAGNNNVLSLNSEADDDGKKKEISLSLQGDRLKGSYNKDTQRDLDPSFPTSLFWQKPAMGVTRVIDSVNGKARDVTVREVGTEALALPIGKVIAHHYLVTGEMERELWYDEKGTLVAGQRKGPDGSIVRLELQQRP